MRALHRRFPGALIVALAGTGAARSAAQVDTPGAASAPSAAAVPAAAAPVAPAAAPPAAASGGAAPGFGLDAYRTALADRRLDAAGPLGTEQLAKIIERAEEQLAVGRRDEAIALLAAVIEGGRFAPLAGLDEGRAATYLLGDALGRAGAYDMARGYLTQLLQAPRQDSAYRRAVARLVDLGLESGDPSPFVTALAALPPTLPAGLAGDVAYLRGVLEERGGRPREALIAYGQVAQQSRYWTQATYRAGLLEVEQGRLREGERLFCRIADPKQTPSVAPLFGGNDFFQIRDLSRLALGRVAHEQYRFDDARYYYHLVPGDSDRLPEALYESATSRYEAKDYTGAHALIAELNALGGHHAYEDEVWILDAYVDLARCEFPRADAKLGEFLKRYEPVLAAARHLQHDPRALSALLGAEQASTASELGWSRDVTEMLRTSVRVDASYGDVSRRLADLDHQLGGLRASRAEIEPLNAAIAGGAVVARPELAVADSPGDRLERFDEQAAAVRRLLREASSGAAPPAELAAIRQELTAIEAEGAALRTRARSIELTLAPSDGQGLPELLARDAALASELERSAQALREVLN
ncbi:MAG TPA: hypothetical protein VMG12_44175, partial [Polyangiaceae bacterium]|nr:hypothetical protein [Polyangiaceae bacterium]